ncbi:uncharacterized protein [Temnothorax nylanderi]|uniref:uncharacterized protein n=1 Tax=Temnothorax nylanderi TaxID=102681 RepID=UPI003A885929
MEMLLSDKDTYEVVKRNPSAKMERELNALIKKWLQKEYISKKQYFFLHSSDSTLSKAYGLPKIHKKNVPFRIIVSSVNTALYNLAAFLQEILADSLPKPKSHVNNSFELCTDLSKMKVQKSEILISLDAVSLFTNVPSELVVEGLKKRWKFIKTKTRLSRAEFITAVKFVLASTFFTFNGVTYKQTFGSPMGSPLSPTVADIVMEDLEERVLGALDIHLSFYKRYVDDIIMKIPKDNVQDVLDHFNSYHDRLKFTIEYENNGRLSFLDLMLIVRGDTIITDWFHKETFSGRLLSFLSNHPIQHKIGTIYSLVDRSIRLSHPSFYNKNLNFVINVLLGNGYPIDLK